MNIKNSSDMDPSKIFTSTCNTYFEHIPYPWQSTIGNRVINSFLGPANPIKQICVHTTGVRKTLLFTTIYDAFKGVTLCIAPIISLGADQSENLNNRVVAEAWLTNFHIDTLDATTMGEVHYLLQTLISQGAVVLIAFRKSILNDGSKITNLLISHSTLLQFLVVYFHTF